MTISSTGNEQAEGPRRYSAELQLRRPRDFVLSALGDITFSWQAAWILFRSNLQARHSRLWLGYLWLLVPGLATAALSVFFRSLNVIAIQPTLLPFSLHVLSGMFIWQSFVEAVAMPQQQLTEHRHTLSRIPVPHESVLLAGLLDLALGACLRIAVLWLSLLIVGVPAVAAWVGLPVGMLLVIALGLALGLFLTPFGLLYDDVGKVVAIGSSFGVLLIPVFYAAPARSVFWLNPITPLLEGVRAFLAGQWPDAFFFAVGLFALLAVAAAWFFYRLAQPHLSSRLR